MTETRAGYAAWMSDAACADLDDPEQFFPEHDRDRLALARTRAVCAACPVVTECLQYAVNNDVWHGIWGGLTSQERHALRRRRFGGLRRPLPSW